MINIKFQTGMVAFDITLRKKITVIREDEWVGHSFFGDAIKDCELLSSTMISKPYKIFPLSNQDWRFADLLGSLLNGEQNTIFVAERVSCKNLRELFRVLDIASSNYFIIIDRFEDLISPPFGDKTMDLYDITKLVYNNGVGSLVQFDND